MFIASTVPAITAHARLPSSAMTAFQSPEFVGKIATCWSHAKSLGDFLGNHPMRRE
jgi:hypothetical protein